MFKELKGGWFQAARKCPSPHFNVRPNNEISALIIHNISLPSGCYGLPHIDGLFQGCLDVEADPSFTDIAGLEVSAHFLIRRDGELVQYVSCDDRAWHAGVSSFNGREGCNDYSIGIEMEGTDIDLYSNAQYNALTELTLVLLKQYPMLNQSNIVGHCDIAPGRKTDPGNSFDWQRYFSSLENESAC